ALLTFELDERRVAPAVGPVAERDGAQIVDVVASVDGQPEGLHPEIMGEAGLPARGGERLGRGRSSHRTGSYGIVLGRSKCWKSGISSGRVIVWCWAPAASVKVTPLVGTTLESIRSSVMV